jgi:hypothetical protein
MKQTFNMDQEDNYDDDDYEEDAQDDDHYSDDEDLIQDEKDNADDSQDWRQAKVNVNANTGANLDRARPRSTQSDPASTPAWSRSQRRRHQGKEKDRKKSSKSAKTRSGKQKRATFVVSRPRRDVSGDRPGDWTDSEDEEERRQERVRAFAHVSPRFPKLAQKHHTPGTSTLPTNREGTPLAMLSLAESAAELGLFQRKPTWKD